MILVYLLLMKRFLRILLGVCSVLVLGILALHLAGMDPHKIEAFDAVPIGLMAAYASFLVPVFLLSANASWLTLLPIRRRKLLALSILLGLSALVVIVFAFAGLVATFSVTQSGNLGFFWGNLEKLRHLLQLEHLHLFVIPSVFCWAGSLGVPTFIVCVWICSFSSRRFSFQAGSAIGKPAYRWGQYKRDLARLSGIALFCLVFRKFVFSGYGFFLGVMAFLIYSTFRSAKMLGIFGKTRRQWMSTAAAVAAVQILVVSILGWNQLSSPDGGSRHEAQLFLGGWAGRSSWEQLNEMASGTQPASLRQAIDKHYPVSFLFKYVQTIRPETLQKDDVQRLFDYLQTFDLVVRRDVYSAYLVPAHLSTEDMISFLNSDNNLLVYYGLFRSRYYRDAHLIPVILKKITSYPDDLKLSALKTLSVLAGTRKSLDFYAYWKTGVRRERLTLLPVNCPAFWSRNIYKLPVSEEGELNVCLREAVDQHRWKQILQIEQHYWFSIPKDLLSAEMLKKGFERP